MDWHRGTDRGGHNGGFQSVSVVLVPVLCSQWYMGHNWHTVAREVFDCAQCRINRNLYRRIDF